MLFPDLTWLFRKRQRYVDKYLFALAPALVILLTAVGGTIAIAFVCIGVWLVFGRHGSSRYFDKRLAFACFAAGFFALGHGANEALEGSLSFAKSCRDQYPLFILLPFLPVGLVLVRRPVVYLVLGARVALVVLSLLAIYWLLSVNGRMGLGTNAVILSFAILISSCVARFELHFDDRYRLAWFYLGLLPSIATGSRISLVFFAVIALHDLVGNWAGGKTNVRSMSMYVLLFGFIGTSSLMVPVINERLHQSISEVDILLSAGPGAEPLRLSIWRAGFDVISQSPVTGAGACDAIESLQLSLNKMQVESGFKHFHNMFIDALAFHGVIGLALLLWLFAVLWKMLRDSNTNGSWNSNIGILFFMLFVYGMTGSFLTDDRMTGAVLLVLGGLVKARKYADFREGWRTKSAIETR